MDVQLAVSRVLQLPGISTTSRVLGGQAGPVLAVLGQAGPGWARLAPGWHQEIPLSGPLPQVLR